MYFATTSVSCTAGKKVYTRVMTTGGETVKSLINKYTPKAKDIEIKSADLSDYFNVVK